MIFLDEDKFFGSACEVMLFGKRLLMGQGFHSFIITELRHYQFS
jgi:hypothetical protein